MKFFARFFMNKTATTRAPAPPRTFAVTTLATTASLLCALGVPASSLFAGTTSAEAYDPAKALIEGNSASDEKIGGIPEHLVPKKTRTDTLSLTVAPEYFFDFGNDLPSGDGWGASVALAVHFNTDTPQWDFTAGLELLGFYAESGEFTKKGCRVTDEVYSFNALFLLGLSRSFGKNFTLEAQAGIGLGVLYDEISGEDFKKKSSGNWTMPLSAKILGEYHFDDHWGVFLAYRIAYISPSVLSKVADWHNLDLVPQSIELGVRLRF